MTEVSVTMRATIQRINRAIRPDRELKTTRGARAKLDLGRYWLLNCSDNYPADVSVNPEHLARELGVLKDYERVVEE
jgi:hypothetical protein